MDYCNVQNRTTSSSIREVDKKKKALQYIEEITKKADEVQKQVLHEILSRSAHVEYLQRHGLCGHTDRETFKRVMPVVTYEDLQPDITRIADGDTSPILCVLPISQFLTSSGTSGGERKLMPMIDEEFERRSLFYSLQMPIMDQYVPDLNKGKGMYFMFVKSEAKTPGGLVAHPALTSYYKSSYFKKETSDPFNSYTSPNELCTDSYQSMYSQLLCGLYQNHQVLRVGAVFASVFLRGIRFLQKHWVDLSNDIRTGNINSKITDSSVKEAVSKLLKPNPGLADFIKSECSKDSWQGIITRLWPNAKYVDVIITGTMSQYIATNLVSIATTSIENEEQQEVVDLVNVQLGKEYELVITTYAGIYRYKVGDILRVAGFKNNAPQFNFVCRKNVVLSIDSDKTDEVDLQNAVKNAVNHLKPFNAYLVDYTSLADTSTIPGHYVLYWELLHDGKTSIPTSVFEDCCLAIEESLNSVYRQGRVCDKSVGPLEIRFVEIETFDKLMDYSINRGAQIDQYKTPRCVKFAPIIELLNSRVLSKYFSPKDPKWVAGHRDWYTSGCTE
ncbi:hypothetical protein C5167_039315 [Papaver somniferum]|uniref:Uncharacterized protein n=1 Tax=Papaver somniferum TaxID=3469 RepID=A0A4Y7IFX5_PAPSO|nr:hypothetical protein C5167_039315 [Papaver somniferum]